MDLPDNAIGVSDLLGWRDCPRRMAFGMARHTPREVKHPETGKTITLRERPEAQSSAAAYGSAVHDGLQLVEQEALSAKEAVSAVFTRYAQWLEPADVERLERDLEIFLARDYRGVRTMLAEEDWRIPLVEHEGVTLYFRFRLDKLYQRLSDPGRFIHVDYKSSRYAKSEEEIANDIQQWAYNWGIHEVFPECENLLQVYDQLNFGQVTIPRKTDRQRQQIKDWLAQAAIAVVEDEELPPKLNQWCAWCSLKYDCPVIDELTDFAQSTIAVLAPKEKVGRKSVIRLDPERFDEYAAKLTEATEAKKVLEKFEEEVRKVIKTLPDDRRQRLGFGLRGRKDTFWTPQGLEEVHEVVGPQFYELVGLTKSAIERTFPEEEDAAKVAAIMEAAETADGAISVVKA